MGSDKAYAELGLAPGASEPQVKAAWRRLVSQWHPDRNGHAGAIDKMQRINRAFEQIRLAGYAAAARAGAAAHEHEPARTVARRIRLTLEEAAAGCTRVLRGKLDDSCHACQGSGVRAQPRACARCGGSGSVRAGGWYAWLGAPTVCEVCQGSGTESQPCAACEGSGKRGAPDYKVGVRIPQGVRDGDLLQVPLQRASPTQPGVELELRVELLRHALFRLDADGLLRCEVPVDGFAWAAQRAIEVPTPAGLHKLNLVRGQTLYRLPGRGFPAERRGAPGELLLTILPIFPERLSTDQQILLDQLAATVRDPRLGDWAAGLRAWEQGLKGSRTRKERGTAPG